MQEVVIVGGVRTPIGRAMKGTLVKMRPDDLSALVLKELIKRTGIDPAMVEDVRWGCGFPEAEAGMNMARQAWLMAELPESVSGVTINRFCASSLEAINSGAMALATGNGEVIIAGGAESMSFIPMGGVHPERSMNAKYFDYMKGKPMALTMTQTAQYVAEHYGYTRPPMDQYAKESQDKTIAAIDAGRFKDQIVPVPVTRADGTEGLFDTDECPRRGSTIEKMASLPPATNTITEGHKEIYITAGNSCPLNDGAAAVLMMTRKKAEQLGLMPFVKIRGMATAGVNPWEMGIGPVPATEKALKRAGLKIGDIDLVELNEAFAVQCLYFIDKLGVPREKVNVNGGAIALGHPFGMTGTRLMIMLMHEMRRRQVKYGLATLCVGGGMGMSTIVEREPQWK
jgi:acetyl-CoA acetyltransferase family protein